MKGSIGCVLLFSLVLCLSPVPDKESLKQVDSKILEQYPYFDNLKKTIMESFLISVILDCKYIVFYRKGLSK